MDGGGFHVWGVRRTAMRGCVFLVVRGGVVSSRERARGTCGEMDAWAFGREAS